MKKLKKLPNRMLHHILHLQSEASIENREAHRNAVLRRCEKGSDTARRAVLKDQLWGHSEVTLRSLWSHFEVTSGVGSTLGSLWAIFGVALDPTSKHLFLCVFVFVCLFVCLESARRESRSETNFDFL